MHSMQQPRYKAVTTAWSKICTQVEEAASGGSRLFGKQCPSTTAIRLELMFMPHATAADLPAVLQELVVKLKVRHKGTATPSMQLAYATVLACVL